MKRRVNGGRRPAVEITLAHAARLFRFVMLLAQTPRGREAILRELGIGIRTFYRELEFVKRRGIEVRRKGNAYALVTTPQLAEGRLPFPDPQLSFAEVAELSRCQGAAAERLAVLLESVAHPPAWNPRRAKPPRKPARS